MKQKNTGSGESTNFNCGETGQNVQQKNTGSGESHNSNCGQNLIKAGVEDQECESED